MKRIAGPLITTMILLGVGGILFMNLDLSISSTRPGMSDRRLMYEEAKQAPETITTTVMKPPRPQGNFREYPIGTEVEKNAMWIVAVWMPPVGMDGNAMAGSDIIHLEADVKATDENRNGFAKGEFIPYLKIAYEIKPAKGGEAIRKGELLPMVASDGFHYGASIAMPNAGEFTLSYTIQPPSAGGLGRHSDPVTGVAPWWEPFTVTFDWDYQGLPEAGK